MCPLKVDNAGFQSNFFMMGRLFCDYIFRRALYKNGFELHGFVEFG